MGFRKSVQLKNCLNLKQKQLNGKNNQSYEKVENKITSISNMYRKSNNNSNMELEDSINTRLV